MIQCIFAFMFIMENFEFKILIFKDRTDEST